MPRKCVPLFSRIAGIHVRFTTWFSPGFGRILSDRIEFILSRFQAQGQRENNFSSVFQGRVLAPRPFFFPPESNEPDAVRLDYLGGLDTRSV